MKNRKSLLAVLSLVMAMAVLLVGCGKKENTNQTTVATTGASATQEVTAQGTEPQANAPMPGAEDTTGFKEYFLGDENHPIELDGKIAVAGVYFQPVDMEPAGNSLAKEDADCHIEADITALANNGLGYGADDFVPWLNVKAIIQKQGSDKVQEVACMPMNASDGPHYGNNIKFEDGIGVYDIKFEISAPGNEYLLHVDKETGVTGRFWTEPLVAEFKDFEWTGPAGRW